MFTTAAEGERGQTTVEYAVILAALALAVIVAIVFLKSEVEGVYRGGIRSDTGDTPTVLGVACDGSYSGACVPPPPPDLDCSDIEKFAGGQPIHVAELDPHGLDPDGDGIACN
jgi:Flp pilus assembly pilin Flp